MGGGKGEGVAFVLAVLSSAVAASSMMPVRSTMGVAPIAAAVASPFSAAPVPVSPSSSIAFGQLCCSCGYRLSG